jgi:hypothetical protein
MIKRPTVFVVGAGASAAYNFPSGPAMLRHARSRTPAELHQDVRERFTKAVASKFHAALADAECDSIDSLLEYRLDLDGIGRAYIAHQILRAEHDNRDERPVKGDWLSYLFNQMDYGGSISAFAKNPIRFITYNYDRRIEHRISRGLRAQYSASDSDLVEFWKARPVIHLHGSVGSLEHGKECVPFGGRHPDESHSFESLLGVYIDRAASSLKVVHQADGEAQQFQDARRALGEAECVVFLGFSFGQANVKRLGFQHINSAADVIVGRYRMTDAEVNVLAVRPYYMHFQRNPGIADPNDDCLAVLRKYLGAFVSHH